MIGQTILHYKILAKLGEGGMGEVYLAEDTKLERKVALKFLPLHYTTDPIVNARFQREAKAAAALNHPNIITVYEIGDHEGRAYIAMEYIAGQSLRQIMTAEESGGPALPLDQNFNIISQVCEGLAKAHQAGVVHRDLKPENIMLDADGKAKILDFGLAQIKGRSRLTSDKSTLGTIFYMSPEQCHGEEVDHRTDIWAVGVMLYEMLTGKLPFGGEYETAIIYSIVNEEPPPLVRHKAGVSPDLQHIVDKALDKDRETRYQGISELLTDLKRVKNSESVSAKPMSRLKKKQMARTFIRYTVLVAFFALVTFAAFYFLGNKPGNHTSAEYRQLTFFGNANRSAISPDGQFIAYVLGKEEKYDGVQKLMLQDLKGGPPLQIYSATGFWNLRWSPDGSEIAFYATKSDSVFGIFIVPRLGGDQRRIRGSSYFCWSPDGLKIGSANMSQKNIRFIDKSTQDTTSIALSGSFTWLGDVDWSPLGNRILFCTTNRNLTAIWTIKTDGSQQQNVITDSAAYLFSPRWSLDGKAIYYLKGMNLMKIKVSSETGKAEAPPRILQSGVQAGKSFTLSKNNKFLLYSRELQYSNLWLINRTGEDDAPTVQTQALTTGTSFNNQPRISPDGKKVAFNKNFFPSVASNIFSMDLEGGTEEQLTFLNSSSFAPAWSPDGKEIAFLSKQGDKYKIWQVSANGGTPMPFEKSDASEQGVFVVWSPGAQILYGRPGYRNFHLLNPKTKEERPLFPSDSLRWIYWTRYSPDGKKVAVYWHRRPKSGLWLISLDDALPRLLKKGKLCPIEWSTDGEWIYAWDQEKKPSEILKISVADGKSQVWITLPFEGINIWGGLSMAPDGKRTVCNVDEIKSDIWLMEHFDPEVK